jgi:plastocyanin
MKKIYLSFFLLSFLAIFARTADAATVYPYTIAKNDGSSWKVTIQNPAYSVPGDKYYVPANYAISASSASELRNQVIYRFQYDLPGTSDGYTFYAKMSSSFTAAFDDFAAKTGTTYTGTIAASVADSFAVNGSYQSISVNPGDTVNFSWSAADTNHTDSFYISDKADTCTGGFGSYPVAKPWIANTQTGQAQIQIDPCQAGVTYTYTFEIYRSFARVVQKTVILKVSNNVSPVTQTGTGAGTGTGASSSQINSTIPSNVPLSSTALGSKGDNSGRSKLIKDSASSQIDDIQKRLLDSTEALIQKYQTKYEEASGLGVNARAAAGPVATNRAGSSSCSQVTSNLRTGDSGSQVFLLTQALTTDGELSAAQSAFDQTVFGAVVRYQEKYADKILVPSGLDRGTGFVGPATRAYMNAQLCPSR